MGLKRGAPGNTLEEHIENLVNIVGTHRELEGNKGKKILPHPHNLKEKKCTSSAC
jgi:hypothetical protein